MERTTYFIQTKKTPLILLMGGLIFSLAFLHVRRTMLPAMQAPSPLWIFIGALLISAAIHAMLKEGDQLHLERWLKPVANWLHIEGWQLAILLLAILFSVLTHYAAGEGIRMPHPLIGWSAWLLGIACAVVGTWQWGVDRLRPARRTLWIALGLSVLAYAVRGFAPESYPLVFSGDEGAGGMMGLHILAGRFDNPFSLGWFSFPGLYFFIQAASISIFGQTLAALRIPSIIAGSLTVGLAYLAGRALYGRRVALLAGLFLAGFQLHIHFSRMGLNNVWDGLFFVAVAGAVIHAWEHENRNAFVLAGFGLGLSQYFYVTGRVLPVLILAWLVLVGWADRPRLKRVLPDIMLMITVAAAIALPLAWFYMHHPNELIAPFVRVNAFGESLDAVLRAGTFWKLLPEKIWLGVLSFTYLPSFNQWFYSESPLLGMPIAAFFIAGIVFLFSRLHRESNLFMGLWLLLFLLIGGLSDVTPPPQRYVVVAPACLMVAALGLTRLLEILEGKWPRIASASGALVLLIGAGLSLKDAISYYTVFTPLSKAYYVADGNGLVAQQLGRYLQTQPEDTQVIFFGYPRMGYYSIPSLPYLAPHIVGMDVPRTWDSEDRPQPDSKHLVFVFLPQNEDQIDLVRADYPGGQVYGEGTYWGTILYYYYVYDE